MAPSNSAHNGGRPFPGRPNKSFSLDRCHVTTTTTTTRPSLHMSSSSTPPTLSTSGSMLHSPYHVQYFHHHHHDDDHESPLKLLGAQQPQQPQQQIVSQQQHSSGSTLDQTSPTSQVIQTNDEATQCKYILSQLGYIHDDYIQHMLQQHSSNQVLATSPFNKPSTLQLTSIFNKQPLSPSIRLSNHLNTSFHHQPFQNIQNQSPYTNNHHTPFNNNHHSQISPFNNNNHIQNSPSNEFKNQVLASPIIIKGYYIRYQLIKKLVEDFIHQNKHNDTLQIINLGSGYDTLYFYIRDCKWNTTSDSHVLGSSGHNPSIKYLELDFPKVIESKKRILETLNIEFMSSSIHEKSKHVSSSSSSSSSCMNRIDQMDHSMNINNNNTTTINTTITSPTQSTTQTPCQSTTTQSTTPTNTFTNNDTTTTTTTTTTWIHDRNSSIMNNTNEPISNLSYILESCDLSDIQSFKNIILQYCNTHAPTLFISEVAMCYMSKKDSSLLLDTIYYDLFKSSFNVKFIVYEPVMDQNNSYGKQMLNNLSKRNSPFISISSSLNEQYERFKKYYQEDITNTTTTTTTTSNTDTSTTSNTDTDTSTTSNTDTDSTTSNTDTDTSTTSNTDTNLCIHIDTLFNIHNEMIKLDKTLFNIHKRHPMFDGIEEWQMISQVYAFLYIRRQDDDDTNKNEPSLSITCSSSSGSGSSNNNHHIGRNTTTTHTSNNITNNMSNNTTSHNNMDTTHQSMTHKIQLCNMINLLHRMNWNDSSQ
ncbi:hypothetical protein C9374_009636 [Naegleria lovaniensis]|uniref:[phosphatase 2A protein]-leucine-carboxy methyltransferase n=1 Tax=Naegleria lovaniensis TaxID=51637 RepID=A0AA88GYS5_NAELO|nr:uncharacterized protein C9374_009636 [Naegleria lovaniensis]KAG2393059.1 hypothetical protein C9374_009636 [Naegleria lovaniensis]